MSVDPGKCSLSVCSSPSSRESDVNILFGNVSKVRMKKTIPQAHKSRPFWKINWWTFRI